MKPVLESVNEFEKLVIVLLEFPEEYNSLRVKKIFDGIFFAEVSKKNEK